MIKSSRGFTLLEIMITLFILMIVGILISTGLNTTVNTQERINKKSKLLGDIQLVIMTLERDMQQASNKSLLNATGQKQPAFRLGNNYFTFTRASYMRSAALPNTNLQRVTYTLNNMKLYRITQMIVNKTIQNKITSEILMSQVKSFRCYMSPLNNPLMHTNSENVQKIETSNINIGVIIEIDIRGLGPVRRVIPLAINTVEEEPNA